MPQNLQVLALGTGNIAATEQSCGAQRRAQHAHAGMQDRQACHMLRLRAGMSPCCACTAGSTTQRTCAMHITETVCTGNAMAAVHHLRHRLPD